jgi:hypothetical protein
MTSPAERLKNALEALTGRDPHDERIPTVTELCRVAAVSRNALYRYHPATLKALHELRRRRCAPMRREARAENRLLKTELKSVRNQIPKIAALVDHYYVAYKETQAMLNRRERELAELRRRLNETPARIIR